MYRVPKARLWTLCVGLLCCTLFGSACAVHRQNGAEHISAAIDPLSAKQALRIANAAAIEWHPDASLNGVTLLLNGSEPWTGTEEFTFSFIVDRRLGPFSWWNSALVFIDPECGCVSKIHTYSFQTHGHRNVALSPEALCIDSRSALALAEIVGGAEYRQRHKDAKIRMMLRRGVYGTPQHIWVIEYYRPPDTYSEELRYTVDTQSGEVNGDAFVSSSDAIEILRRIESSNSP